MNEKVKASAKRIGSFLVTHQAVCKGMMVVAGAVVAVGLGADAAHAITAPTSGFAQEIYDLAIDDILNGPIGFVGGTGAMAVAAICAIQQKIMPAVCCALGGATLLQSDALVTSLGMLV